MLNFQTTALVVEGVISIAFGTGILLVDGFLFYVRTHPATLAHSA